MRIVNFRRGQELRLGVVQGESVFDLQELSAAAGKTRRLFLERRGIFKCGSGGAGFRAEFGGGDSGWLRVVGFESVGAGAAGPEAKQDYRGGIELSRPCGRSKFQGAGISADFREISEFRRGAARCDRDSVGGNAGGFGSGIGGGDRAARKGHRADEAFDYVAGYMALNDVSARKWQFADKQWTRGKSCDTFCPTGPWLTTRDEIADPHKLRVIGRVNGEVFQDSNTAKLIFGVPELIAFISEAITLEPGRYYRDGNAFGGGSVSQSAGFYEGRGRGGGGDRGVGSFEECGGGGGTILRTGAGAVFCCAIFVGIVSHLRRWVFLGETSQRSRVCVATST